MLCLAIKYLITTVLDRQHILAEQYIKMIKCNYDLKTHNRLIRIMMPILG